MKRKSKFHLLLAASLGLIVLAEGGIPPAVNWLPSFSAADKIPYGTYVTYQLMSYLFPDSGIRSVQVTPHELLRSEAFEQTTYIFINDAFEPDPTEAKSLLDFVENGNQIFISADGIGGVLADTLRIETSFNFILPDSGIIDEVSYLSGVSNNDSVSINFVNPALKSAGYHYKRGTVSHSFEHYDSSRSVILGINDRQQVNYLKVPWGAGAFWLNSVPHAFTNYNVLLPDNRAYVEKALAYLPAQDLLWDEHHKAGRREVQTPIRYILSQRALRWAYGLTLFTIVLFILFEGKRRRRAIPLHPLLPNDTLEFVDTMGRLYYHQRDHQNITQKKITYFQDYLRTHFSIVIPDEITVAWYARVAEKTGRPEPLIKEIFEAVRQTHHTDEGLLRFNRLIEQFHENL
jgi:hypothetical protein